MTIYTITYFDGGLEIACDDERLNVVYQKEELRELLQANGVLHWNHNGVVGKVPKVVLRETLALIDTYYPQHYQPRVPRVVPGSVGWIRWDQVIIQATPAASTRRPRPHHSPPEA